jgi:hypothetical protein
MKKRGMGAATKGGGCCMGGMTVKKYAGGSSMRGVTKGSPEEGITGDMREYLPGVTRSLLRGKGTGRSSGRGKRTTMTAKGRTLPYEPSVPR